MRETLSKRHKSKAKPKVASARTGSNSISTPSSKFGLKKKKELKSKPATSGRPTASVSKQSKISTAKVARKVAKNAQIKKAVKTTPKNSSKKPASKAPSRLAKAQKKVVAKRQVKTKSLV